MKEHIKDNGIYVYPLRVRQLIKQYLSNITSEGIVTNKEFLKTIGPFLTNKACVENS